jgi:MYXO-CTERM domain-containing protein
MGYRRSLVIAASAVWVASALPAAAQFTGYTSLDFDLAPTGLIYSTPSLAFLDQSTLLVGSIDYTANNSDPGSIYQISVTRGAGGHIDGFSGSATLFAATTGIDGGLTRAPGDVVLYTTYSDNNLGQIKLAGGSVVNNLDFVPPSVGSLAIVPSGFAGAGQLKLTSFTDSSWYSANLALNASGFYDVTTTGNSGISVETNPEGIAYVAAGNPGFSQNSILLALVGGGSPGIYAYGMDSNGDPIAGSGTQFMAKNDLGGLTVDPLTGDLLMVTIGAHTITEIQGFTAVPEPGAWSTAFALLCLGMAAVWRRRR